MITKGALLIIVFSWITFLGMTQNPKANTSKVSVDYCATLGGWIPTGNNSFLGVHPAIGLRVGIIFKKFSFGAMLEPRFLRSWHDYKVIYHDSAVVTHDYFGGLGGFYLGLNLLQKENSVCYLIAGWGKEGFNAIQKDPPNRPDGLNFGSQNVFAGLGWMLKGYKKSYLKMELAYNLLNYENPGGTSLIGNALMFRVGAGLLISGRDFEMNYHRRPGRVFGKW
jgi:hypothetical protein